MASSGGDFQFMRRWCKVAGMGISAFKSEAMVLEKGGVSTVGQG